MSTQNKGKHVAKMAPEESAIIQNISALLQQLQSTEASEVNEPGGPAAPAAPAVAKTDEQTRTPAAADNVSDPNAPPKDKGMANWGDDEVKKAFSMIAKAMMTSDTKGPAANDDAEDRLEDNLGPDNEDIPKPSKEVEKWLAQMGYKKTPVAKSQSVNGEMFKVMKAMADRLESQGNIIGELLEGLGIANAVTPEVNTQVQKAQGGRPVSGGAVVGADMVEVIAMSVAKALQQTGGFQQSNSGIPVAKGFGGTAVVPDDIRQFTEAFSKDSGWARPVQE